MLHRRAIVVLSLVTTLAFASCLSQERTTEGDPVALARQAASNLGQLIAETRALLAELTEAEEMSGNTDDCEAFAKKLLEELVAYTTIARATREGVLDCSAEPSTRRVEVKDRLYFTRARETKDFSVGEYQVGRLTGEESIAFAQPVVDEREEVSHVIIAPVDLEQLEQRASEIALPRDASLTVLDGSFNVLARADSAGRWTGEKPAPFAQLGAVELSRGDLGRIKDVDGVSRRFGSAIIESLPDEQPLYVLVGVAV